MIVRGILEKTERQDLRGKPYTLDLDQDFFRIQIADREVAFSDYFPSLQAPNEYVIVDFDKDGRVVGYAIEGIVTEWARKSLKNRAKLMAARTILHAQEIAIASKVISEVGMRVTDAFPKTNQRGQLPAYA